MKNLRNIRIGMRRFCARARGLVLRGAALFAAMRHRLGQPPWRRRTRLFFWSGVHAAWVLLLCYLLGNNSYSLGDEEQFVQHLHFLRERLCPSERVVPENLLAVNVAYDKQLVECVDEYGLPAGSTPVTDRRKLLQFLQLAKQAGNYGYILLDVSFERGLETSVDSALFATIASMDRLVIPCHEGIDAADSLLLPKQALADYRTSVNEGNFVKYRYLENGRPSMAWKMYADLTGAVCYDRGPFCFCNGRLSYRSLFLNFTVNPGENAYLPDGRKQFYNLGADLLDESAGIDYAALLNGRIVIMGDLTENDIHDTYVGPMSGAYIHYNAFLSLLAGKQYVNGWSMSILFVIYFLITLFLTKRVSVFDCLPLLSRVKSRTWRFVFSWCGFSIVLSAVCAAFYFVDGFVYDILLIATYFSLFSTVLEFCQTLKKKES